MSLNEKATSAANTDGLMSTNPFTDWRNTLNLNTATSSQTTCAPQGGCKPPLGNNTKSVAPQPSQPDLKARKARKTRFKLLKSARFLSSREAEKQGLQPYDHHRVSKCHHCRTQEQAEVWQSDKGAYFAGVVRCGSVWACPVCANKIQEERRIEIAETMGAHYHRGGTCIMVTLTFPHYRFQSLQELIDLQSKALKKFRSAGSFRRYLDKCGYVGLIRSLELTHGQNGWHPHTHEIWFIDKDVNPLVFQDKIKTRWTNILLGMGIGLSKADQVYDHAAQIEWDVNTADYLAKTANQENINPTRADFEVGYRTSKKGRKSGRTPFQILADYADKPNTKDGNLYVEYMEVMKGKRAVFFSQGLKRRFGLDELTDQELADAHQEDAKKLLVLDGWNDWQIIRDNDFVEGALSLVEDRGAKALDSWLMDRGGRATIPVYQENNFQALTLYRPPDPG
jgi:hypothetical protein